MMIWDQFGPIQNLQRALFPKTSNWSGTIFSRFLQQTVSSFEKNTLDTQRFFWQICQIGTKVWDIVEKRLHGASIVRGLYVC